MQFVFDAQQLRRFFLFEGSHWYAGPTGDDFLDVIACDYGEVLRDQVMGFSKRGETVQLFLFFLLEDFRALEVAFRGCALKRNRVTAELALAI